MTDAVSRNALFKIHVSLGKIVNTLDEQLQQLNLGARSTRSVSVNVAGGVDEKIGSAESTMVKAEEEDGEDHTITMVPRRGVSVATDDTATLDGEDDEDDTVMRD